ncbi:MAG: stage V sporulation protein AD [Clostridiales bacterium]|nr:MAG: stage V sporulation protein AD [Clostridiales bacterium]
MKKIGKRTFRLENTVGVLGYAAVVGEKEKKGPLGHYFENFYYDEYCGQKTFEKAEAFMQKEAIQSVIESTKTSPKNVDFIYAGDLLNQCIGSNYGVGGFDISYFGVYGACSTMAETLTLAAMSVDGGFAQKALCVTSSHYCAAERQYRFPLEYGSQRASTAQWTVTGSGCVLIGNGEGSPRITEISPGVICDKKIADINNMGTAMAPAAIQTLVTFFEDTSTAPENYDLILTGDLGHVGHAVVAEFLKRENYDVQNRYQDCGMLIYDHTQDAHAGGSGCGCSASVLCGFVLPEMRKQTYRNVLFVATGALMSPTSILQGENIPGIAHLVHFEV